MQFYTVGQVTSYLRELIESDLHLNDVWIEGEVTNLKKAGSGHTYFSLKDAASQLRCALFSSRDRGYRLDQGDQVLCQGHLEFYPPRGEVTFMVAFVQPAGAGPLQAEFERRKALLAEEGLFEENRKRPLPAFPSRIGVVTSPHAAAWQDIQRVISRRWPLTEIVLSPTPVQGYQAVAGITEAMERLREEPGIDVIIVARGGGSMEDLWSFNEEEVARAIFRSPVPVVTGIGHEDDFTISDFVADVRGSTPSAAAELTVPDRIEIAARTRRYTALSEAALNRLATGLRRDLRMHADRLERSLPSTSDARSRILRCVRSAGVSIDHLWSARRDAARSMALRVASLSPQATLDRGYAIVQSDGHALRSPAEVSTGQALAIRLAEGDLDAVAGKGAPVSRGRAANRRRQSELQAALPLDGAP
ncbi:MAG: exodeoxyribonuclease VII large subunit [Dehalococcoidia bacterium]|nr:exodeoxyribonuclease VII large subunit [Dehalococcoidia bacterium]